VIGDPIMAQIQAGQPRYLLTLTVGSRVVRLTDGGQVAITRARATDPALVFTPGLRLDGDPTRLLVWLSASASSSLSMSVMLPFDLAAALERGSEPTAAEVAYVYPGQTWEARRVLIAGAPTSLQLGDEGELVTFTITDDVGDDQGLLLVPTQRVTDETFPRDAATRGIAYVGANERISDSILGAYYPILIGSPGDGGRIMTAGAVQPFRVPASPALYVERTDSNVIEEDHAILVSRGPTDATSCTIYNATDGVSWTGTITQGVDMLGQAVSLTEPVNGPAIPLTDDAELYVSFDGETGGMPDPFGSGPLRRADHVIRWALSQSSLRWDWSQSGRLEALRAYQIDGYINDPTAAAWPWVQRMILPLLPVSVISGPAGRYLAPLNPDATAAHAVARLEVGRNCERITPRTYTSNSEVVNDVRVEFGLNAQTGNYSQWRQVGGSRSVPSLSSDYAAPTMWGTRSQSRYGVRSLVIQTPYIYDGATAELVAHSIQRLLCLPRVLVGYLAARELDWLRPGDVVAVTDQGQGWTSRAFHVEGLRLASGAPELAMTAWPTVRYNK